MHKLCAEKCVFLITCFKVSAKKWKYGLEYVIQEGGVSSGEVQVPVIRMVKEEVDSIALTNISDLQKMLKDPAFVISLGMRIKLTLP